MPIAKLTKRVLDTIQPGDQRVIYYDSELKGFGLKVSPAGGKTWCVEYRPGARGRSVSKRRMVLGSLVSDAGRSRTAVSAEPLHGIATANELVAIGFAVQPACPPLAKLVGLDPPNAVVRYRVADRKRGSNRAHGATHAAIVQVADRQLESPTRRDTRSCRPRPVAAHRQKGRFYQRGS